METKSKYDKVSLDMLEFRNLSITMDGTCRPMVIMQEDGHLPRLKNQFSHDYHSNVFLTHREMEFEGSDQKEKIAVLIRDGYLSYDEATNTKLNQGFIAVPARLIVSTNEHHNYVKMAVWNTLGVNLFSDLKALGHIASNDMIKAMVLQQNIESILDEN